MALLKIVIFAVVAPVASILTYRAATVMSGTANVVLPIGMLLITGLSFAAVHASQEPVSMLSMGLAGLSIGGMLIGWGAANRGRLRLG